MSVERDRVGPRPDRLVDVRDVGWHLVSGGRYEAPGERESWTYARVVADRGPVREVIAPAEADVLIMRTALERAGRLAAGSLAVALHQVVVGYSSGDPIVAGGPELWESEAIQVAWHVGDRLEKDPTRWDRDVVEVLAEVIRQWTAADSSVYIEVAQTVASIFGDVARAAGGWEAVSDERMQPAWLRTRNQRGDDLLEVDVVRNYLMSQADLS
jgi:hypothetical protein